jgi:GH24 family phage-related lysozyme (muramidase)
MFGGEVAQATEQLGTAVAAVGHHWGEIVANDMVNQFQAEADKIVHGDPQKQVVGPDGTIQADLGYLGTRGQDALTQRPLVDNKLSELTKSYMGKLYSADQKSLFDTASRRYRAITMGTMGRHADQQGVVYATGTADAQAKLAEAGIARSMNDPEMVKHETANLIDARVKKAMVLGAKPGDPQWMAAKEQGEREAVATHASAVAVHDPQRAMQIIEDNKSKLGAHYDDLANRFRARKEQADGRGVADGLLTGAAPPAGDDTKAVLRHFEQFRENAYRDNGGAFRVGYGSDTVTKADGSVVPVTKDTVVTQEDAERDLERRAALSQKAVRDKVGGEAFDRLSPEAKASLTSITYNYGDNGIPQSVVDAAKTGDPARIAQAIRGLAGHNGGINAGRRASEANNVAQGDAVPRSQAELIADVVSRGLPPQAEAAAIARINKSYALNAAVETKRKAEFKQQVDDSLTEALVTGTTSKPVPESDFIRHFGAADGAAKFADYQSDIIYSADRQSVETMSDVEQQQFLNSRMPQPGVRGYAHAIDRHNKLIKEVATIQEARRNDPAGVVAKNPAVQAALGRYDEKNPESFKAVADARLAAQEQLGIDPEYRSPITKAEALKLMSPVQMALPGMKAEELEKVGTKYRAMFGDEATKAFIYSLRAIHVAGQAAADAEGVLKDLMSGKPLTQAERRDAKSAQDAAELDRIAQDIKSKAPPLTATEAWMNLPDSMPVPVNVPNPGTRPVPNNAALRDLRDNKTTAKEFDVVYGPGTADKLMKEYPFFFNRGR